MLSCPVTTLPTAYAVPTHPSRPSRPFPCPPRFAVAAYLRVFLGAAKDRLEALAVSPGGWGWVGVGVGVGVGVRLRTCSVVGYAFISVSVA